MTFTELLADARRLVKDTNTAFTTSEFTSSANRSLEYVTGLIREAQGRWQWDDSNETDFAIATTTLTTDVPDYSLDGTSHFRIERVEVKDTAGSWTKLKSIDQADIYDQSLTDFMSGTGIPQYYDKVGNSLFLYPTPSYTQSASLKLFFERGPSYFETTDTTKTPGFNPLFHRLISLSAAYDYAFINQLPVATSLQGEIAKLESQLQEYYTLRDLDEHIQLKARNYNYR